MGSKPGVTVRSGLGTQARRRTDPCTDPRTHP